jgi:hypothetical protein
VGRGEGEGGGGGGRGEGRGGILVQILVGNIRIIRAYQKIITLNIIMIDHILRKKSADVQNIPIDVQIQKDVRLESIFLFFAPTA